jgi:hypothetical protein
MKKLKQKILTGFFFASALIINAQTFSSFNPPPSNIPKCSVPPSNMINSILASVPLCSGQTINDYYTNAKDTIYINLNFWVAKPTSGIGVYDNITYNDALNHIIALNTIMDSLYAPHLVIYSTPTYIKKSKIRFILKNFAFVINNNIYSNLKDSSDQISSKTNQDYDT